MALSAFTLLRAVQNSASGTGPAAGTGYTPASFTTVSGSLLVVALAASENGTNTNVPATITLTNSAGLTFTLQKAQSASTTFDSGAMIWTAPVTTGASMTVTFTSTVGMGTYGVVIGHYASGFDPVTPVLGTGGTSKHTGFSPPETGAFTLSNAPLVGDEIFALASNNQALTTTPGSGWTEIADVANTSWSNIEVQTIRGVTSTSVAWTSLYATGSAFSYSVAGIVVKAAAGGSTPISVSDTGSASDTATVSATVPITDTASGSDAVAVAGTVHVADTASAADAIAATVTVPLTDAGSAADSISVNTGATPVTLSDTGSASDALTVTVTTPLADTAGASDAVAVAASIHVADTAAGADTFKVVAALALAEAAAALDSLTIVGTIHLADTAVGADAVSVNTGGVINKALTDSGTASDSLCVETLRPDSGDTTRPSTGTTTYALATTARPSSGTTTRPNTGTTDPC